MSSKRQSAIQSILEESDGSQDEKKMLAEITETDKDISQDRSKITKSKPMSLEN